MNAHELYTSTVYRFPADERLKLAALILGDLAATSRVDDSETWSAEDERDITIAAKGYAARSYPEEEELVI